jgi:peptidyl-prolyl cis-trans isomerase C
MTARSWSVQVVVALGLAGSSAGAALAQPPADASQPAAVVNGETVTMSEVDAVVKLLPQGQAAATDPQKRLVRHEALDMLMDDVLMRQFLHRNGRPVTPDEVNKRMTELTAALKAQKHTLRDFLNDTAQTEEHLKGDIVKKLQWEEYVSRFINEPSLRRYYEENRDFYDQVTVRASHILLRVPADSGPADLERARAQLLNLRQQIAAGRLDFAEAARKYSQCASAAQGGDIMYFPRKWAVDENIARAAFALKVGEVSEVVQTDYGLHLIKVTDRKPGQPSSYDKLKDEVRENYTMEMWQNVLAHERKNAQIRMLMP